MVKTFYCREQIRMNIAGIPSERQWKKRCYAEPPSEIDDTGGNTRNSQRSRGTARTEDADIRPAYAIVLFVAVKTTFR